MRWRLPRGLFRIKQSPSSRNAHPAIVPLSNFRLIVSGCASSSSGGLFPKRLKTPWKDVSG